MAGHYLRAALIFACTVAFAAPQGARADDPDFLSFGGGYFDWNRQKSPAAEFRFEYRSDQKFWVFKPLAGLMGTSDGAVYAYAGVGIDVFFGRRLVVTPSFAPGYYHKGSGLELGHELKFRSQIEFAYRFEFAYRRPLTPGPGRLAHVERVDRRHQPGHRIGDPLLLGPVLEAVRRLKSARSSVG